MEINNESKGLPIQLSDVSAPPSRFFGYLVVTPLVDALSEGVGVALSPYLRVSYPGKLRVQAPALFFTTPVVRKSKSSVIQAVLCSTLALDEICAIVRHKITFNESNVARRVRRKYHWKWRLVFERHRMSVAGWMMEICAECRAVDTRFW